LESCLGAIAAGDGREILRFDKDGQIQSLVDETCLTLVDGDTTAGGALSMEKCDFSAEAGDGRSVFQMAANGQMQMPRMGSFCLSMVGNGAAEADVALGVDVSATSSSAQHVVKNAVDGDANSFWASGSDPTSGVDLHMDLGVTKHIRAVEIDWEYPAQAFELQVARGGVWSRAISVAGNNLKRNRYQGLSIAGSALRIRMTKPHPALGNADGHALFGIRNIRVIATSTRFVVQDCSEAEDNSDARDKFFMSAVPNFDPSVSFAAKQGAGLLAATEDHLGNLLASLYAALPTLAACGFVASSAAQLQHVSFATTAQSAGMKKTSQGPQEDSVLAVASLAETLGVDMRGLQELVAGAEEVMKNISR